MTQVAISGATLHVGDALDVLRALPSGAAQCCVTSPPYYGLRDYGVDGQIGLEATPDAYVARLVEVFREVRRVLAEDGVCWLNLGDSYSNGGRNSRDADDKLMARGMPVRLKDGAKPKDLLGIPWRVAFALQSDGWYLRQDVIWAKPNALPESVRDRCTKSHEYLFLLTKRARYYYNADAISEPVQDDSVARYARGRSANHKWADGGPGNQSIARGFEHMRNRGQTHRNRRSVWMIPTKPYKGAHFAVMPPKLVEPCILAGSRPGDVVLDPFSGSGTVGAVALAHGRRYLGIDLNPDYIALTRERIAPVAHEKAFSLEPAA